MSVGTSIGYDGALALWEQAAQSLAASGQITAAQLQKALAVAPIMAAIAGAESTFGGNPGPSPTGDYGIWQINVGWHPQYDPQSLMDSPFYNAAAAVQVYLSQGLGAWSTYNSGAYRGFLPSGEAGGTWAPSVGANHGGSTPPAPILTGPWSQQTQHLVITLLVILLAFGVWSAVRSA